MLPLWSVRVVSSTLTQDGAMDRKFSPDGSLINNKKVLRQRESAVRLATVQRAGELTPEEEFDIFHFFLCLDSFEKFIFKVNLLGKAQ